MQNYGRNLKEETTQKMGR